MLRLMLLRLGLAAVVLRAAQAGACSALPPSPRSAGVKNHSAFVATGSARCGPWGAARSGVARGPLRSPHTLPLARPLSRRGCATQFPSTMTACSIPAIALRGGASVVAALPSIPARDLGCLLFGLVGATAWLKIWTTLASMGYMDPKVSRKVVHCGSAPLFMLTWPFYTASSQARLVAALVPMVSMIKLLLAGYGRNDKLVSGGGGNTRAHTATNWPATQTKITPLLSTRRRPSRARALPRKLLRAPSSTCTCSWRRHSAPGETQ